MTGPHYCARARIVAAIRGAQTWLPPSYPVIVLHTLPTLRRKGYQGRSPWLVCALRLVPIRATCEHWPRFIRSPDRQVFGGLLCRFSARGHQSEIMLGVLVVVFCPDYIAGLGLGLG